MSSDAGNQISPRAYEWTCRAMAALEKVIKVRIRLHDDQQQLEKGDIFLFNHFARFETFIPQYLIHRETGAYCRCVAAKEFFRQDNSFSRYLRSLGAVPTNHPGLLPFLVAEVLRGHKIVVFPEGGMVKDRRVLDADGGFSVFSRMTGERRKHHTGAAVVGLALEAVKLLLREAHLRGQTHRIESWVRQLGVESAEVLLARAQRPTSIVPCNITFHPLRITTNPLNRLAELLRLELSPRAAEELVVEGNILLRKTDMDFRMADPIRPSERWTDAERERLLQIMDGVETLEDLFGFAAPDAGVGAQWLDRKVKAKALEIRDLYMERLYSNATVNLSHLASRLILRLLEQGQDRIPVAQFHRILYLAVKKVQGEPSLHLHYGLGNPDRYEGLLGSHCPCLDSFLEAAAGLLEIQDGHYVFLPKLREEQAFDRIRLENVVMVYGNEVAPLVAVHRAVEAALAQAATLGRMELALLRFDDQLRAFRWDWEKFRKPVHAAINRDELGAEAGLPFLQLPKEGGRRLGVLLVHGFSSSPAEIRPLADRLAALGYPCLGVRLKGHGTSPWDLVGRSWKDWMTSVREGYEVLAAHADQVILVGFSAGAALGLRLAAEHPEHLAGVSAVCTPVLWREKGMGLLPVVHGVNHLAQNFASGGGVWTFHRVQPEHPDINYHNKPMEALYELQKLIGDMCGNLGRVRCPVMVMQASDDPTVDPSSAQVIFSNVGSTLKQLVWIPSDRHGILQEDTAGTLNALIAFVSRVEADLDGSGEPQGAKA